MFNLMFKTFMGPVEEEASTIYLRPQISTASIIPFLLNINCEILARRHRLALEKGKFVGS